MKKYFIIGTVLVFICLFSVNFVDAAIVKKAASNIGQAAPVADSYPGRVARLVELLIVIRAIPDNQIATARHFIEEYLNDTSGSSSGAWGGSSNSSSGGSSSSVLTPTAPDLSASSSYPTITLGVTPDGATTTCTTTKINLAWAPKTGAYYHNIRVNDHSNVWGWKTGGETWCKGYDGDGDLCKNGLLTTSYANYFPVVSGHTYSFWVDYTTTTGAAVATTSMTFSVPLCPARPTLDLKIATTSQSGPYVSGPLTVASGTAAWLRWTSTGATTCDRSASPTTDDWRRLVGTNPTVGTSSIGIINANRTYSMTCAGPGGEDTKTVFVNLIQVDPPVTNQAVNISTGGVLPCTVSSVNLQWSKMEGDYYYNIRVNDKSDAWGGKTGGETWCKTYDGGDDLCKNGLTGTSYNNYPVKAGHSYDFWMDSSPQNATASRNPRSTSFSVPASCAN